MASSRSGQTTPATPGQCDAPVMVDRTGAKPQLPADDEAPRLTHVIPTIFVPLKEDLLKPIELARDRVERMQRMRASLDANEMRVRENIIWIYEREARRHVMEAQESGVLSQPRRPAALTWEEADRHLANIAAGPKPNVPHHLPPEKIAEFQRYDQQGAGQLPPNDLDPHERLAREVLAIAHRGVRDMEEYSTLHIKVIRDQLDNSIEREKRAHG